MKGLKCIKLLILSTIFLPLFGICSSVSALKYDIVDFPIAFPNSAGTALSSSDYFEIQFDSSSYIPSLRDDYYFSSHLISGSCSFGSTSSVWKTFSHNIVQARIPYFPDYYSGYFADSYAPCMRINGFSDPSMDWSSINQNESWVNRYLQGLAPYWYPYKSLLVSDINSDNGLYRVGRLELANLFKSVPDSSFGHLQSLRIPLGYPNLNFQLNDSLQFHFESDLDSNSSPNANLDVSNLGVQLVILYNSNVFDNSTCSTSIIDRRVSDPDLFPYTLKYTCNYIFTSLPSNYDFNLLSFRLQFYRLDSNISTLFDYPADVFSFYSSYVITNNNDNLAGRPFVDFRGGGDPSSAPGSASDPSTSTSDDWFSSLSNLFKFSIINPFQPIFAMFSGNVDVNNERCASIPTIAGMLHSSDTVVCPFFPVTVRSIGTSVLGLASSMLIFGFFVHWLGSASGNNIEDSSTHSWGRFNVKKGGKS